MSTHSDSEASASHTHVHPNYFKIWGILVLLLITSVLGPLIGIPALTLITAFGIAIVKALMVAAYFMHLNVEKKIVWYILLVMLALMFLLFFTLAPDIMKHSGTNWHSLNQNERVIQNVHH